MKENLPASELIKPKYVIQIIESQDFDGTRRLYVPVLEQKASEFYEQHQSGSIGNIEGTLDEVIEQVKLHVETDKTNGIQAWVETPEEYAKNHPSDSEYVLPE
jgi:hypothetical protein